MEEIAIKMRLNELSKSSTVRLLEQEIALSAIQTDDPIHFLRDMYRNNGLKYDLRQDFFFFYCHDIAATIRKSELQHEWEFNTDNYEIELSFLGYQLALEKMLIQFGMLHRNEAFFAHYGIIEVQGDKDLGEESKKNN